MPRPGGPKGGKPEKSKDFFGSMKRLFSNLNPWKYIIIISLILAMASAIISLIAPNKLSDFADIITNGLKPNTDKLTQISNSIGTNLANINYEEKINVIATTVSDSDYQIFLNTVQNMNDKSKDEASYMLLSLPESVLNILIDDINIDGKLITSKDQVEFLKIASKFREDNSEEMLSLFDSLPNSIYEEVKPSINMDKIRNLAIFLGTLYLISALFSYIQNFSMTTVSNNFARVLRNNIINKINKLPLRYFDNHETGDILSRVTNDVDLIAQSLNQSLGTLVTSITLFIGSIIMMFYTNAIMAITAIISSFIGFIFMGLILKNSQKYFNERQVQLGKLNGYIEEMYSGYNVVKAYNGSNKAKEEFAILNKDLYEANRKSMFLSGLMQPIMGFVGNLGYVAVCIVGALLVSKDSTSFGVIVAFMVYIRLFTNPLSQIAQAMTSLQSTAAASERVFEFIDEREMSSQENITKHLDKSKVKGNITFSHVKFGYDKDRTIIKDFSVDVKSGQKVAIVGPTGAGKTTMVNLLMKFYEINDGDILIDGVSINELTRENIHDLFCMVLQDTWLFEGTIRDNIKFNKNEVSDEQIWEALKTVGVDHFVKALPGALEANLNDNDTISQGQKQLFTIARGMLEDAPFLILDEATSNVDTRTEELVASAMDKLTIGRTSFIIAHRLSTIKNADIILVMNEGNIIEQGTHDELIAKKGFYEKLYNSQFEKTM